MATKKTPESKTVLARNTVSGQIATVPRSYLTHPHFGKQLVEVDADAKNAEPELYHPTLDGIDLETGKPKTQTQEKAELKAAEDETVSKTTSDK